MRLDLIVEGQLLDEAKAKEYKSIPDWYSDLIRYIEIDPEVNKKPLREKIKLFKQIQQKIKAEQKTMSGWSQLLVVMRAIIPYQNIYQYFSMNGNQEALVWLLNSPFPIPSETEQKNENAYKSMLSKMLQQTSEAISVLERKLSLFDEKAAKQNPVQANQELLYKINKHFG